MIKKDNLYSFRVIIEGTSREGYHGFVPLLRGVHTQGKTINETKKNLREAIKCHIQGLLKDRIKIPSEENAFESVELFSAKDLVFT